MIGKTLGHYEITSQLGRGGMGEVYRAKDQKLGRDVAIKVLPEEFARDTDRVARFQREAKLLASLNHPNIAAIYGLEESGGTNFLVLELVEGETLAEQLKRGAISVEESLKLALQISEALEAAHEKGIIHRDLKPANIKVTPDGKVKVLDFGLAKAFAGEQANLNLSNSPTLSNAATQQGVILGTAAYMSPEQARGESVDKKADIWAFGCVLFEMLTGCGMFEGRTVSDTLAAVLMREPEWKRLPPNLHPRIRLLLERCLEKEAKNRCSSIGEARVDIQKALADPSGVFLQSVTAVKPWTKVRTILPWVAAAIVLTAIIAGVAVWKLKPSEPRQVMRFDYELPEGQQFNNSLFPVLAVSPDGKQFVYSTNKGLYLRSVGELTAKLIPGTEEMTQQPFFSPDGKWIGYFSVADRKLKKIIVNGGAPVTLCDVTQLAGASWGADNTIIYATFPGDTIMRVPANGGIPKSLIKAKAEMLVFPQILPDGKSVLYSTVTKPSEARVMVQSLKSGEPKELFAGSFARYLPTGHIVYQLPNNNNLFAIPFDLNKLVVTGGPVPIVEGVFQSAGVLQYAVSDSGTLAYMPGAAGAAASGQHTLIWVDRKGKETPITAAPNDYRAPRISPDGTKAALLVVAGGKSDIWIWDFVRETMTRLTFSGTSDNPSVWTLDGRRIAFGASASEKFAVYLKAADGTGEDEQIYSGNSAHSPWTWSSDGKTLLMEEYDLSGGLKFDIGALSMEGDRKWRLLLKEKYSECQPNISPDGRWVAYTSDESGQYEIYVRPFPEMNKGRWQISTSGGNTPLWSRDGRELFYRKDNSVIAVDVQTEPTFKAGKPQVIYEGRYTSLSINDGRPWDISPDGKRFLMIKAVQPTENAPAFETPRRINIVLNWFEELKQRVPVK